MKGRDLYKRRCRAVATTILRCNRALGKTPDHGSLTRESGLIVDPRFAARHRRQKPWVRGNGNSAERETSRGNKRLVKHSRTSALEHRAGGGGRQAANHVYQVAKPDGLTLGALSGSIVALNVLGATGVMYDIDKFIYLGGSESTSHQILYTRKELALSNPEKLRAASGIRIGAQAVGHPNYIAGRLFAYFLGFKEPKFIVGTQLRKSR